MSGPTLSGAGPTTPMRVRIMRAAHALRELHRRSRQIEADLDRHTAKLESMRGTNPSMDVLDPIAAEMSILTQEAQDTGRSIRQHIQYLQDLIEEWAEDA